MTEGTGELNGIPFTARVVVDDRMRRRLRLASIRVRFRHPVLRVMIGLGLLGGLLAAAVGEVALSFLMFMIPLGFSGLVILPVLLSRSLVVPSGSSIETGFGPHSYVVRGPNLTGEVAYTTYRKANVVGDFVVLFQAGSPAFSLLPRVLFPDSAVDAVNSGVGAPSSYGSGPQVDASFVVPAGWASRAATAYVVAAHRRRRAWVIHVFLLFIGIYCSAVFGSPWWLLYPLIGTPAIVFATWLRSRRALLVGLPVGSVVELSAGEDALTVRQPSGLREMPYSAYTEVRVTQDLVLLKHRLGGQVGVFPRELFPPETLAAVRAKVTGTMAAD